MKNENIKIPFGIYEGQIIHISSAVSGREYECCECGSELIPVISNKIASHFRHKSKCKCDGGVSRIGGESPIHKYAKKIILEEKKVYIDEDNFIEFREVKEEYKINGTERIVDLYCVTNDYREIAIEIFYKHKVESDKVQELKDNKVRNVLEINIPDITNFKNDDEIREGIIKNFIREMLINKDIVEENKLRKEKLEMFEAKVYKTANDIRKQIEEDKKYYRKYIAGKYLKDERRKLHERAIELNKRRRVVEEKEQELETVLKERENEFYDKIKEREEILGSKLKKIEARIKNLEQEEKQRENEIISYDKIISKRKKEIKEREELIKRYEWQCYKLRQQKENLHWEIERIKA